MYKIYKGSEFFGVYYDDIMTAIKVSNIFEQTLGYKFHIRVEY